MGQTVRTNQELEDAAKHIMYEWNTLKAVSLALSSNELTDGALRNAALESVVVHVRSLREFFYYTANPKKFDDDVTPSDFLRNLSWTAPAASDRLIAAQNDANKHLAHISYARIGKIVSWDHAALVVELGVVMQSFLSSLPTDICAFFK